MIERAKLSGVTLLLNKGGLIYGGKNKKFNDTITLQFMDKIEAIAGRGENQINSIRRLERLKIHSYGVRLTPQVNKAMHIAYKDICQYCKTNCNGKGWIDHIIPVIKGGEDNLNNYILACEPCNRAKLDYLLEYERLETLIIIAQEYLPEIVQILKQNRKRL